MAHLKPINWLLGLAGAIGGGALGFFVFFLLAREGFYGMILPGALVGIGCGALSGCQSNVLGLICCALACGLGIFTEWRYAPFNVDDSFSFFVAHLHDLSRTALISMAVGGFFGYWFGRGRPGGAWLRKQKKGENLVG
jgi:hypothetical protein